MRRDAIKGPSLSPERATEITTEDIFTDLFNTHVTHIFNFCNLQLNDSALAEEITGDVFARAWNKRHSYNPAKGTLKQWLFQIARHRLTDEHRKQRRRITLPLNEEMADQRQLSPEETVERSELKRRIIHSMADFTDDEKMVVALKFGAGLNNQEIAEIMNKTNNAVGSSLHRAMLKLRAQWGKEESHE